MSFRRIVSQVIGFCLALLPAAWAEESLTGTNLWTAPIPPFSSSSPAVATNGVIYHSAQNGQLLAFDPEGRRLWTLKLGFETVSSPAIADDGTILVGNRDRRLYAVTSEGKMKWSFPTGGWVDASAAIGADSTIYFGSWDWKLYALSPDGGKKWEFATKGPVLSSAAIDGQGTIYFGSDDGRLYALNPDGSKRWEFPTRGPIISSPAIANNGDILFTSLDGRLYAVDVEGKQRWSLHTGGITRASPAVAVDGTIYLGVNSNHCAITAEGKIKWRGNLSPNGYVPPDWIVSTPAVIAGDHSVTTGPDLVLAVTKPEGVWRWIHTLETGSHSSPCVGLDGTVYAVADGRKLFAFQSALPLAASAWPMFRANPQHTGRAASPR